MGQAGSTADLACAQSCKDWGEKDISTVKIDLASINALTCPEKCDNHDPLSCLGKGASKASHGNDKELVTDKENAAPQNSFKVPKFTLPFNERPEDTMQESTTASTTASTPTASVMGNDRDLRVPRLNLQAAQQFPEPEHPQSASGFQWSVSVIDDSALKHESLISPSSNLENAAPACIKQHQESISVGERQLKQQQRDAEQQLLAADLAEQTAQPETPKAWTGENDAVAFELKVTRMGWSQSQHKLVRREVISICSATDIRPDMKVCDLKNLLKDHKMSLKSGEVINTDDMVLTTPRELAVGSTLSDGKTLAESGVGPNAPDVLLLHTESVRKACCSGRKGSPPVSARSSTPRSQWQQVEEKKAGAQVKKEQEFAEQRIKVDAWLKSNGFKDINELVRKRLTKARPLHVAVGKGDAEMVRLLLLMGADPRMCNGKSETPMLMAKRLARSGSSQAAVVVSAFEAHLQTYQ
eukprot:gnl/MRDRNA2_/MRDRNA2_51513_c0_seq1.p1 gnl/MRDRNA2_/MRDRNA2_51513_c0~~gnl/MRDRNA2_/MRDRNA2_51513_c0_seq1.p1  ORF type:complete len:470 (-),score=95.30 gnl/MRDRNA2_/MRDRNA2_51513_c0_seq1:176-1585(-)